MQITNVTTPFGRRPMALALFKRQLQTAEFKPGKPVEKWKVFRDACEAREHLGLQDRALAQEIAAERLRLRRAKEALTICRRDVRKLITAAIEEGAEGDWDVIEAMYVGLIDRLPRNPDRTQVEAILDEMQLLLSEVINILESQVKSENMDGNASQNGCHIQNSKPESINESEPRSRKEQDERALQEQHAQNSAKPVPVVEQMKVFPLAMVLRACPQITDYGPNGAISHWRELMTAAVVVRSMLGVSPSAYQEACEAMGPENAATAMACILERAGHINSAGGYLRDLTRRARLGEFGLGPMLMSLMRLNSGEERQTA